jgi:hypothetical protein
MSSIMRLLAVVFISLAIMATCGCMESINDYTGTPTPGVMPTAEPLPTPEPLPTAQPLPTAEPLPQYRPTPTITPVPPAANDPIIGTFSWHGANNTYAVYQFNADGTFQRQDSDSTVTYMGVWERKGPDTYNLTYTSPNYSTETITYLPAASGMARGPDVYTRA